MRYWQFNPAEQNLIFCIHQVNAVDVNEVFDISKVYQGTYEIDIFSGKPLAPIVSTFITKTEEDCEDCGGYGFVEIADTIGRFSYSADCECKNCDGEGNIKLKEPLIVEQIEFVEFNYNGIKFTLRYHGANLLFEKHGTQCKYEDDHIIFTEN